METNDLANTDCPVCGKKTLALEMRLEARDIGTFSLSGQQMKFSCREWPYVVCGNCGVSGRVHT